MRQFVDKNARHQQQKNGKRRQVERAGQMVDEQLRADAELPAQPGQRKEGEGQQEQRGQRIGKGHG